MKRRKILRYGGASLLAAAGSVWASNLQSAQAQANKPNNQTNNSVLIQYFGHTCFLFTGGGKRILVNPFRAIGCTAGYALPKVSADLVLVSSQLWDEGAAENLPGNPKVLFEPGVFEINGFKVQGISGDHDRKGGRQFGQNVAWRWTQAGVNILHLGGAAAPIGIEQKILLGTPDLALIPVGGSAKAFNPEEAKQAIEVLRPKIVIPTQYLTAAANKKACDILPVKNFLDLMKGSNIQQLSSNQLSVSRSDLPKSGTVIRVLNYRA
jgi:L-ascorbate metabolism protein UlaG (beta-lactamase superfamily)